MKDERKEGRKEGEKEEGRKGNDGGREEDKGEGGRQRMEGGREGRRKGGRKTGGRNGGRKEEWKGGRSHETRVHRDDSSLSTSHLIFMVILCVIKTELSSIELQISSLTINKRKNKAPNCPSGRFACGVGVLCQSSSTKKNKLQMEKVENLLMTYGQMKERNKGLCRSREMGEALSNVDCGKEVFQQHYRFSFLAVTLCSFLPLAELN